MNKAMEKLRQEIVELCNELEVSDYIIYCNGKRYMYRGYSDYDNQPTIQDADVESYLEYCNPDTLSMAFEGELHSIFTYSWNIPYCERVIEKFRKLFAKYGLYYELGNSWNLSLYEK